jgi:hypothetical protein
MWNAIMNARDTIEPAMGTFSSLFDVQVPVETQRKQIFDIISIVFTLFSVPYFNACK